MHKPAIIIALLLIIAALVAVIVLQDRELSTLPARAENGQFIQRIK